jgi:hypothetical protein
VGASGSPVELEVLAVNHLPTRRPRRRLLSTAASLVAVSLLAVGCGDDGGEAEAQET